MSDKHAQPSNHDAVNRESQHSGPTYLYNTPTHQPEPHKGRRRTKVAKLIRRHKWLIVAIVVALVALGVTAYFVIDKLSNSNTSGNEGVKLANQLKDIVDLPNEVPSFAVVQNASELQDQPFFQIAQDGDQVLIYQKDKKALLYRPSTGKIIEYSPVNISQQ